MDYKLNNKTSKIFNDIVEKLQAIIDNGEYEKFLNFKRILENIVLIILF